MPGLMPDVSSFLSRGRQRMLDMQAAGDAAYDIEDNATSGLRPDLLQQLQAKLALEGMRNARAGEAQSLRRGDMEIEQMDPGFQRSNRRLDTLDAADTYMNPRMGAMRGAQTADAASRRRALGVADSDAFRDPSSVAARGMGTAEDLRRRKAMEDMALMFATDPRRVQLAQQEHQRKLDTTRAGSRFGAFIQPGAGGKGAVPGMAQAPSAPIAADAPIPTERYTAEEIREYVTSEGGTEQDVMKMIAEVSAQGLLTR